MKRILSIVLAITLVLTMSTSVFASYDPTGYYNPYNNYNSYNIYRGDDYSNASFSNYYGNYYLSPWISDFQTSYNYPTLYESFQRPILRGEFALLYLRAVQKSLTRQGYSRLMSGYNAVPFTDYSTINPYAQSEVNVLYANGLLVGYGDNTMRFNQPLTRAEGAAFYSRFNRIFFNMGVQYNQNNYTGYNNYYNNNYNNYYSNFAYYTDINGHWAAQDIITASANGVLRGVGNNYFDTEGQLTVEQAWKMLDCCVGYMGLTRSDIAYAMSQTFKIKFGKIDDDYYVDSANGTKITRISASTTTISMNVGDTRNIEVSIYPTNATYQKMSWSSSNTSCVSVEETWNPAKGKATVAIRARKAISGYVDVTGRALDGSGKTVTIKVKVNNNNNDNYYDDDVYISSITMSESVIYLTPGESVQVNARIRPTDAYNKNLTWSSNNASIARVSDTYTNGSNSYATVTAANTGETYIYANARDGSGVSGYIRVVVRNDNISQPITSAVASPSSVTVNVGGSQNCYITSYPTNATDKEINYISDNPNIARVVKNSNTSIQIIGVGVGSTTIRGIAVATGKEVCTIPVTVNSQHVNPGPSITDNTPPVVSLEGATSVNVGDTITIIAKVHDETSVSSFIIGVNDIIGMTGSLSPVKVEKISNTEYRITLMGVEVASQCICIKSGVATDAAGNASKESNEIVIFVNSGE